MEPLRPLLKTREKWDGRWGQEQRTPFEKIKDGIYAFTPGLTTSLCTDWINTGMGIHMTQKTLQVQLVGAQLL